MAIYPECQRQDYLKKFGDGFRVGGGRDKGKPMSGWTTYEGVRKKRFIRVRIGKIQIEFLIIKYFGQGKFLLYCTRVY